MSFSVVNNLIRCSQLRDIAIETESDKNTGKQLTRPSEASSSRTGDSRTDAMKQKDDASRGVARGYQIKSRMGAAWGNTLVLGGSKGGARTT